MFAAIEQGWPQREIQASAYRWQREVEEGQRVVVGVNAFRGDGGEVHPPEVLKVEPAVEQRLAQRVREHRARRDRQAAQGALDGLRRAAEEQENLLEPILAAGRAGCTTGGDLWGAPRRVRGVPSSFRRVTVGPRSLLEAATPRRSPLPPGP